MPFIHDTTILIPHYRTGKMTSYCIHQILKHKGNNDVHIIVIDNSEGEGIDYLHPFANEITIVSYPTKHAMQSHGIAFDYAIDTMKLVETPYFITLESDSFPVQDGFLDIYRHAYASGFDMIGSQLQLSGGNFIHPTGAMYTTKLYNEAAHYVKHNLPYMYIPNAAMKDNFPCHLMVKEEIFLTFLSHPRNYIEPNPALEPYVSTQLRHEQRRYLTVASGVFHQGMGYNQESFGARMDKGIWGWLRRTLLRQRIR